ncbi:hypothetical protein BOSEA31B_13419 [Hyphomicrobiales bacterium]|nr:hypothetical protein BOSEA31B_13419 [Hyphomicrobiales bacterium]CAH1699189.1 hypothetical protein BOSEA1005_12242 [Hyphomicrobiales bacterium]CAI0342975.1 hypothetical protein BO1005MUT1_210040 [Hyphomicrobiales bacterium]
MYVEAGLVQIGGFVQGPHNILAEK